MVFSSGFTLESAEEFKKKKAGIKIFGGRGGICFKVPHDCFRTKVLRIPLVSESPGGILKTQIAGFHPRFLF